MTIFLDIILVDRNYFVVEGSFSGHHVHGKKVTKAHSTVTDATEKVVKVARKIDAVKRIAPGEIRTASGGKHRISVKSQEKGAIVLTVRMPISIQEITLYTDSVEHVLSELRKKLTIT